MYYVRDDFRPGTKTFGIPLSWFRSVARFINSLCSGTGIKMSNPAEPSAETPISISIDEEYLKNAIRRFAPTGSGQQTSDAATAEPVSLVETDDNDDEGIVRETTSYTSGDNLSQAAARVTAKTTGTWEAGTGRNLVRYEISSIAPFMYSSTRYAKIFIRLNTYSPSGRIISQGEEVDQNIIIRLY